eukprot:scaffold69125_cov18-Tisochrysis_lutea.AAC.6
MHELCKGVTRAGLQLEALADQRMNSVMAGEQPNLAALVEALVPHISGSQGRPHEASWRAAWLRSLFQGAGSSSSSSEDGGSNSSVIQQAGGVDGGRERFERIQQLLLQARAAQHGQHGRQQQQEQDKERLPSEAEARAVAERVIKCNAYGTRGQDFAAAHMR